MYSSSDEGTRSSDGAEGTPLSRGTSRDSEGSETFKPCHCGEKKAPGQLGLAQQQDGGNGGSQVSMHDPTAREWASEMLRESMRGSSEDDEYRPLAEEYDRTVCHGYYPPGFSSLHTEITNWNEGNQNPRKMYCFSCGGPGHKSHCCPMKNSNNGTRAFCCYRCGAIDHQVKNCSMDTTYDIRVCHRCNLSGHISRHCPYRPVQPYPCLTCGLYTHLQRDCKLPARCHNCSSTEHKRKQCPACLNCRKEGHGALKCTEMKCNFCSALLAGRTPCDYCSAWVCRSCHTCEFCGWRVPLAFTGSYGWPFMYDVWEQRCNTLWLCALCGYGGHWKRQCKYVKCLRCYFRGHIVIDCPYMSFDEEVAIGTD